MGSQRIGHDWGIFSSLTCLLWSLFRPHHPPTKPLGNWTWILSSLHSIFKISENSLFFQWGLQQDFNFSGSSHPGVVLHLPSLLPCGIWKCLEAFCGELSLCVVEGAVTLDWAVAEATDLQAVWELALHSAEQPRPKCSNDPGEHHCGFPRLRPIWVPLGSFLACNAPPGPIFFFFR